MATLRELELLQNKKKQINDLEKHIQDVHLSLLNTAEYQSRNHRVRELSDLLNPEFKRVELRLGTQYERNYGQLLDPKFFPLEPHVFLELYFHKANSQLEKLKNEFEAITIQIPEKL